MFRLMCSAVEYLNHVAETEILDSKAANTHQVSDLHIYHKQIQLLILGHQPCVLIRRTKFM